MIPLVQELAGVAFQEGPGEGASAKNWAATVVDLDRPTLRGITYDCGSQHVGSNTRHDEGRKIRHLRLVARDSFRVVRLLSLRHAGAVLRRAVFSEIGR